MTRNVALDNAKGIAIIAVVVFHVSRGFESAGMIERSAALAFADACAYGFHVQTFFLIAGYLAFARAGSLAFQRDRQISLYYAYLFWSLVSWCAAYVLSGRVNNPVTPADLVMLPIRPIEHFWFLPVLMIGTALLGLLRTPYALLLGLTVMATVAVAEVIQWYGMCVFLLFMLVGGWLRAGPGLPPVNAWAGWACAGLLGIGAWLNVTSPVPVAPIWFIWASLAGCYACYALASAVTRLPALSTLLSGVGRNSMAIYLLHVFGGAGARIVLRQIAPDMAIWLALLICCIASIVLPLAGLYAARRLGISRWVALDPIAFAPAATPALGKAA